MQEALSDEPIPARSSRDEQVILGRLARFAGIDSTAEPVVDPVAESAPHAESRQSHRQRMAGKLRVFRGGLRRLTDPDLPEAKPSNDIAKRAEGIQTLIDQRRSDPFAWAERLTLDYQRLHDRDVASTPEDKSAFEDELIAYLICRHEYVKHVHGHEDFAIASEQIPAIVALVTRDHLQAPTSFGKSQLVIPIAAATLALSERRSISVTTVTPKLKADFVAALPQTLGLLPEPLRPDCLIHDPGKVDEVASRQTAIQDERFKTIARLIISRDPAAQAALAGLNTQQRLEFFRAQGNTGARRFIKQADGSVVNGFDDNKPAVVIFDENGRVFHRQKTGTEVKNEDDDDSIIIFDEIHAPWDRATPYQRIMGEAVYLSAEDIAQFISDRIYSGIVWEIVQNQNLIDDDGEINDQAVLKISSAFNVLAQRTYEPYGHKPLVKAIRIVAKELGVSPVDLEMWYTAENIPGLATAEGRQHYVDAARQHLVHLAAARRIKEGVHYAQHKKHVPRDYMVGVELPAHQFLAENLMALQTINGKVELILPEASEQQYLLEGWLDQHRNGITGLSGTFLTPSLIHPDRLQSTALSRFMAKITGRPITVAEPRPGVEVVRYVPTLRTKQTNQQLENWLTWEVAADRRQTVVYCYDENDADHIAKLLQEQEQRAGQIDTPPEDRLPQRQIIRITSAAKEDEVDRIVAQFGSNPNAVLIVAGQVTIGTNFVDSQGRFTDHKTIIWGVPHARSQIFQAEGRRRLPSTNPARDFVWFTSEEQLADYCQDQHFSQQETDKLLAKYRKSPLSGLDRTIEKAENQRVRNAEFTVKAERMTRNGMRYFERMMRRQSAEFIKKELAALGYGRRQRKVLDQFCQGVFATSLHDYLYDFIGCPGSLYYAFRNQASQASGSADERLVRAYDAVFKDPQGPKQWLETIRSSIDHLIQNVLMAQIESGRSLGQPVQITELAESPRLKFMATAELIATVPDIIIPGSDLDYFFQNAAHLRLGRHIVRNTHGKLLMYHIAVEDITVRDQKGQPVKTKARVVRQTMYKHHLKRPDGTIQQVWKPLELEDGDRMALIAREYGSAGHHIYVRY